MTLLQELLCLVLRSALLPPHPHEGGRLTQHPQRVALPVASEGRHVPWHPVQTRPAENHGNIEMVDAIWKQDTGPCRLQLYNCQIEATSTPHMAGPARRQLGRRRTATSMGGAASRSM